MKLRREDYGKLMEGTKVTLEYRPNNTKHSISESSTYFLRRDGGSNKVYTFAISESKSHFNKEDLNGTPAMLLSNRRHFSNLLEIDEKRIESISLENIFEFC